MIRIKECPWCGEKYGESDNFCSKHDELVKLIYSKNLVKMCPKCGAKYEDSDNYCSKHDDLIDLVYIDELSKKCSVCDALYPSHFKHCIRCGSDKLVNIVKIGVKNINFNPNKYYNMCNYINELDKFENLLSKPNIDKLMEFNIKQTDFDEIINGIIDTYQEVMSKLITDYNIDFDGLDVLDKILLFSKSFVKTSYKEGGGDLGYYEFNRILIDDRASNALQITTIIHELSHFLLSEILEQIISFILNTNKTDALEAFVSFIMVTNKFNYLVDEYCAHTVEGRYAVYGYQDYGSYKMAIKDFLKDYDQYYLDVATKTGNTFATYIKKIMASFIDDCLRDEIKWQYHKINDTPNYPELRFETSQTFEWDEFLKVLRVMIVEGIESFNSQNIEKLEVYAVKFRKNNGE